MNILVSRKSFVKALELVKRAIAKTDTKPILRMVKIAADVERGDVTLSATDLEAGIRHHFHICCVQEGGAICVGATDLHRTLKTLTDEDVILRSDATGLHVGGMVSECHLPTENADDFPDIPAFTAFEAYRECEAQQLHRLLDLTGFAASKESTKFMMNCTRLELNGKMVAIATDTKRISLAEGPCVSIGEPEDAEINLPIKSGLLLKAMCETLADDAQVRMAVGKKPNPSDHRILVPFEAIFDVELPIPGYFKLKGNTTIYTRLMEGRWPPVKEVFPKKVFYQAEMAVDDLGRAMFQMASVYDAENRVTRFAFADGMLTLSACSPFKGDRKVGIPVLSDSFPEPMAIGFDTKRVYEMLRKMPKKAHLVMELVDPTRPGLFRTADGSFKYLMMPDNL